MTSAAIACPAIVVADRCTGYGGIYSSTIPDQQAMTERDLFPYGTEAHLGVGNSGDHDAMVAQHRLF